jgi:hypothetical protein
MFYYQRDPRWKDVIMTSKQGQWIDTIGDWGCLVTCIANVLEVLMDKKFTPKDLNDLIRECKGYKFLFNQQAPEPEASILIWWKVKELFPVLDINNFVPLKDIAPSSNIIVKTKGRFHFINLLSIKRGYGDKMAYICYDVWDNKNKIFSIDDLDYCHEIKLKGF